LLFAASVALLYSFWEWGAANFLTESVHPPATVNARFIGSPAPELSVPKERMWSKQEFHLSSLRGVPVLLHFWATWCGPCLPELPELLARAGKLRAEGFGVVAVAVDESWAQLDTFFLRHPELAGLRDQTILALDPGGKIAERFGSSRFPETFLINDQLVIDNKLVGQQPWNDPGMDPYLQRLRTAGKPPKE
jgi:thiol-disulfide isomerase/thioredoxin